MRRTIAGLLIALVWLARPVRADEPPLLTNTTPANPAPANPPVPDTPPDAASVAYFEQHVRPLLEQRCFKCHSAATDEVRGGLRLDSRQGWRQGGDSGPAIVPGKPDESLLVRALRYSDETLQMPPAGKLPETELAVFSQWIRLGAPDPRSEAVAPVKRRTIDLVAEGKHWAYQPLSGAEPPSTTNEAWARTPIDRFILAKLDAKGLAPNPPAERRKLIRRAFFDTIGLPPSPEEVEAFVADTAPDAYDKLVDGLLADSRFGERWARHWLDVARFAESHGFEQDYDRPNAYHYRDFVIKAFNQDLPFDTFVRWQLAGDELAPGDPLALAATGFLAAGVHATQITANQAEKERYDELDDMTRTVGATFLGLTVGCARCHDHKFDPIPNRDYYGLAATFTTTVRSDYEVDLDPEGYQRELAAHQAAGKPLHDALAAFERDELPARFEASLANAGTSPQQPGWIILEPLEFKSQGGAKFAKVGDGSLLLSGPNPDFDVYTITAEVHAAPITSLRVEALADKSLVAGGPGRAANGNIDLTNLRVVARPLNGVGEPREIKLANPRATFEQNPQLAAALIIDDQPRTGWAVDPQFGKNHAVAFETIGDVGFDGGALLEFTLEFNGNNRHNIGRPRLSVSTAPRPARLDAEAIPAAVSAILAALDTRPFASRSETERRLVLDWHKPRDPRWQELHAAVVAHDERAPAPHKVKMLISSEGVPAVRLHTQGPDFYDKTFVLKRGDPNQKVTEAAQGFLTVLTRHPDGPAHWIAPPPSGARTSFRRAALAGWLTDVDCGAGALLARVIVNRLWQHHLGRGIVATPSDFGAQGERPTHPELLDWLAGELIRSDWRLKPIHKLILTSGVYLQTGEADDARIEIDPENELWWRRPGRRLEAEIIRDSLLATSGLLDPTMHGPGTLKADMRRRSIYFFVKRSQLTPMMTLFDAPDSLQDLAVRSSTVVAPQALFLLNSPLARAYAEGLAARARASVGAEPAAQVTAAYRIALARPPVADELAEASEFLGEQTRRYSAAGQSAAADVALADFCQALLSLNEFVFID